jgi:hypothetical protein
MVRKIDILKLVGRILLDIVSRSPSESYIGRKRCCNIEKPIYEKNDIAIFQERLTKKTFRMWCFDSISK